MLSRSRTIDLDIATIGRRRQKKIWTVGRRLRRELTQGLEAGIACIGGVEERRQI